MAAIMVYTDLMRSDRTLCFHEKLAIIQSQVDRFA
jgi:hypothetical protein